jgi:CRP/FNR family transcriptional regulator, cyclic AMP receptor protein
VATFFDYPDGATGAGTDDDLVFLSGLSPAEWDRLVAVMERRRFAAGDVVMARGEADRSLYLIASGSVDVLMSDGRDERSVQVQGPGTILGEVAFFDGRPRSATVRALTDAEVLRLGTEGFDVLAGRHPDLARRVVLDLGRILASRLRQAEAGRAP